MHENEQKLIKVFIGTPEGKRPLWRPRHRWKHDIAWILKEQVGRVWTGFIYLMTEIS